MGSSPVTSPTQNAGMQVRGIQAAGALLNAMAMVIPLVGANTELGQALAESIRKIGKHVQPGSATPSGQQNFLRAMALRQQQMGPALAAMRAQGAGNVPTMTPPPAGGGGGPPGGPPGPASGPPGAA